MALTQTSGRDLERKACGKLWQDPNDSSQVPPWQFCKRKEVEAKEGCLLFSPGTSQSTSVTGAVAAAAAEVLLRRVNGPAASLG